MNEENQVSECVQHGDEFEFSRKKGNLAIKTKIKKNFENLLFVFERNSAKRVPVSTSKTLILFCLWSILRLLTNNILFLNNSMESISAARFTVLSFKTSSAIADLSFAISEMKAS
jgi:methyl-accepting chemotaxis protein